MIKLKNEQNVYLADVEELPLNELTVHFEMGRTAVSKHLAILKEAGLVTSSKVGGGINTTVTWTLKHEDGTTYLHLEQTGFEKEDQAFNGAKFGWVRMGDELKKLLGDM